MKKVIIFIVVVIGIATIGFIACNSWEKERTEKDSVLDKTAIEQVGIMHNQELDSILNILSRERIRLFMEKQIMRSSSTEENFEDVAYNVVINRVKKWNSAHNISYNDDFVEKMVNKVRNTELRSSNEIVDEVRTKLTPFQQEYYDKITAIMRTKDITIDELKKSLFDLEQQIEKESPTIQDAELLLIGTTIARYSSEYWEQNAAKWNTVLNSEIVGYFDNDGNYQESVKLRSSTSNGCDCAVSSVQKVNGSIPEGFYPYPGCPCAYIQVVHNLYGEITAYIYVCPGSLLYNPKTATCEWSFSWADFGLADFGGGVTGLITGLVTGAGAIATAGGNAIGASATNGITQLFNHWW